MKSLFKKFTFAALHVSFMISAQANDVWVRGYTTHRGTFVAPHARTAPDQFQQNNFEYTRPRRPVIRQADTTNYFNNLDSGAFNAGSSVFDNNNNDEEEQ